MSFRSWALSLVLFAAAACNSVVDHSNPYDPDSPPALQAKARLTGKVLIEGLGDSDDRSGARVSVKGVPDAFTAADGTYSVPDVPPGTYSVEVSRDGFDNGSAFPVVITLSTESAVVAVPDISLRRSRGTVRGTALLEGATRSSGISVLLSASGGTTETDAEGAYVVAQIPTGTYEVVFSKQGFKEVRRANVVVASAAATVLDTVTLSSNPGSITGQVVVRGAADNSGVTVTATGTTLGGDPNTVQLITPVDDPLDDKKDGEFELTNVAAGIYNVTFAKADYITAQLSVAVSPGLPSPLPPVALSGATGSVSGLVTLEKALDHTGVLVELTPKPTAAEPQPSVARAAVSDVQGRWEMEALPVGGYDVRYSKRPGYEDETAEVTLVRDEWVVAASVELVEIPGVVTGKVLLEGFASGDDLSNTKVSVDTGPDNNTRPDGTYDIEAAAGPHVLKVHRDGFRDTQVQFALAPGDTLTLDDLSLAIARGQVHGTLLVEERDADASGALVTLTSDTNPATFTALTDRDGAFRFVEVPAGSWSLDASLANYVGLPTATAVVVQDGDTEAPDPAASVESRTLALRRDASLGGTLSLELGASPTTASVKLIGLDVNGVAVSPSAQPPDAAGAFTFSSLPPGTYRVRLSEPGCETLELPTTVLSPGQSVSLPPAQLSRSRGSLTGRYALSLAPSHEGVQVSVQGTGAIASVSASTLTDSGGAFALLSLPVGIYQVTASKGADWETDTQSVEVLRGAAAHLDADPVTLGVVATGSLSGLARLEGLTAPGLGGTTVALTGRDFRGQSASRSAITADDGSYSIDALAAGDYLLRFERAGFDVLSGVAVRVPTAAPVPVGDVQLSLSRGSVHGALLVQGRTDASGVLVTLSATARPSLTALTDSAGAFRFERVPVGTWSLDASLASYTGIPTATVAVLAGEDTEAPAASAPAANRTLALRTDATLTGAVAWASGAAAAGVHAELTGADLNGAAVTRSADTASGTGAFSFTSLPPGTYSVRLWLTDYESLELGPASLAAGQTVTLAAATLQRSRGDAAGTLRLSGAASHENIRVALSGTGPIASVAADALTDASGAFLVTGLPVGSYAVSATKAPDWQPQAGTLTVVRNDVGRLVGEPLSLQVVSSARVLGKVLVDKGATAGTRVWLRGTDLRGQAYASSFDTGADGLFQFTALVGGSYALSHERTGFDASASSTFSLASGATLNAPDALLRVSRGEVVGSVQLSAGEVTGFAVGDDRSGVRVGLEDESGVEVASTLTDSLGAFRFTNVAVSVVALAKHRVTASREHFAAAGADVLVLAGSSVAAGPIVLALTPGTLTGLAFLNDRPDDTGRHADSSGVTVSATGVAYNGAAFSKAGSSAANGAWTLDKLPPGTFEVRLSAADRRCEGGGSFPVLSGESTASGTTDCYDLLPPGALVLASVPAWTKTAELSVALLTAAVDPTQPSNLRGYQFVRGRLPVWAEAGDPAPSGPFTFTLEENAENTLWVRAVDWMGNVGPESSVAVRHDSLPPDMPEIATPRPFVNATTTSVTLSGAEGDASFETYLACSAEQAPSLGCAATPGCTPLPVASSFALSLTSGRRTCLWAQSRDLAGNTTSAAGPASVTCDLARPGAPVIAPVYEPAAFTARADGVDVFLHAAPFDALLGDAANPLRGIDYLEVDSGGGFVPLCPTCRADGDLLAWDPCSSTCTCTDARLRCASIGSWSGATWQTRRELRALHVPLAAGATNRISVRGVDLAGNVGDGASIIVAAEGMRVFAEGIGPQMAARFYKDVVAYADNGSMHAVSLSGSGSSTGCIKPSGQPYIRSEACNSTTVPESVVAPCAAGLAFVGRTNRDSDSLMLTDLASCGAPVTLKTLSSDSASPEHVKFFGSIAAAGTSLGWAVVEQNWDTSNPDVKEIFTCQLPGCAQTFSLGAAAGYGHLASLRAGGNDLLWAAEATQDCSSYNPRYRFKLAPVAPAPSRLPSTAVAAGTVVWPGTPNGHRYLAVNGGTTGAGVPAIEAWPTAAGGTFLDGTVTWKELTYTFEAQQAMLSTDGKHLFTADNTTDGLGAPSAVYRVRTAGADGFWGPHPISGTDDDPVVENVAAGESAWGGLTIEAGRAIAVARAPASLESRITVWEAAPDGAFKPGASYLRHLVAKGGSPATPELGAGLLVYAYGSYDKSDMVAVDLTTLRWESAAGWEESQLIAEDGTVLFQRYGASGETFVARSPSGAERVGPLPGFLRPDMTNSATLLVTGKDVLFPVATGIRVLNAGADGEHFTADDVLSPAAPPLNGPLSFDGETLGTMVAGGGNALVLLADSDRSFLSGHALLRPAGGSLKDAVRVPITTGGGRLEVWTTPAVSDRLVAWSEYRQTGDMGSEIRVQYVNGTTLEPAGSSVALECEHFAKVCDPNPADTTPGWCKCSGDGVAWTSVTEPGASWTQVNVEGVFASGSQVAVQFSGKYSAVPYQFSQIVVFDPGPNGRFDNADGSDDSYSVVPLNTAGVPGLIVQQPMSGRVSMALAGDYVGFIANGSQQTQSTQVYLWNRATGSLTQRTSHFSAKEDLHLLPSGRMVWRDTLFDYDATFAWLP